MSESRVTFAEFMMSRLTSSPLLATGLLIASCAGHAADDSAANALQAMSNPGLGAALGAGAGMALPLGGVGYGSSTLQQPKAPQLAPVASQPAALPPLKPTPFQQLAEAQTGQPLPLYGFELFDAGQAGALANNLPVAEDYTMGPGDTFGLRLWGQIDADIELTVDSTGQVFIPRVGSVTVAGVRFAQLPGVMRAAVGRIYRNFELALSSGKLKTLNITVIGQVRQQGVFPVSSIGTVATALAAAGGPNADGSLRQVTLRRRNGQTLQVDFYRLLASGDALDNHRLQSGDTVFVPKAGPRVAVAGGVVRAGIYELVPGASLTEALTLASGARQEADIRRLSLDRLVPNLGRKVEEVGLPDLARLKVQDGDILQLPLAAERYDQSVSLRGHVSQPRRLAWHDGLTLSDLIDSPEQLRTAAFWRQHSRQSDAGTARPDPLSATRASTEVNWDYATIERLDPETLGVRLLSFNLRRAVIDKAPGDNLALQPGDIVTLYSANDIRVPKDKRPRYVRVTGEVAAPGVYRVNPEDTLPDLLRRIGGITPNAYLYGLVFSREEVRARQQAALERFLKEEERSLQQQTSQRLSAAVDANEQKLIAADAQSRLEGLAKLREQSPEGRMVIALAPDVTDSDDLPEVPLEDGDSITIPAVPTTVSVLGEVFTPGDFLLTERRVGDYLDLSGGLKDSGELSEAYLIRANGTVVARKQDRQLFGLFNTFGWTAVQPGDAVVVPPKLERVAFMRNLKDIAQVFSQFGLGAAAIRSLSR